MLDPSLNRIPNPLKSAHLMGACGSAMSAVACMLKQSGVAVTGSDAHAYPPMSTFLARRGVTVNSGFCAENLNHRPDLVVVGNVITRDNPEARALAKLGLCYCSMPQAVVRLAGQGKRQIMVSGTHGKTTISSMIAWILHTAGLDPSFFIGGITRNFQSNHHLGAGDHLVVEGDEYDTAFFDKGPKFLHFSPVHAVVTGIEFDHADIFADLAAVNRAFFSMLANLPESATVLAHDADENLARQISRLPASWPGTVARYGKDPESPWRLGETGQDETWNRFQVIFHDKVLGTFRMTPPGEHNRLNALAACAVAASEGVGPKQMARALESFQAPRRRQEIRGRVRGVTVMDDFAHHPTAVRETIRAVKPMCANGRLIAVFEPRTNTSMRDVFQTVYPSSFKDADMAVIRTPSRLDKIAEDRRFSSARLAADINAMGVLARHFETTDQIIDFLVDQVRSGDLVLIMSNGGFDNIHQRLLTALEES